MVAAAGPDGLLVLDKPAGPTSHDCVARVRRLIGTRRVGHAGTLDPFATGVLACCVGRATRLVRWLAGCEKTYEAELRLGFATDTGDREGRPLGDPVPVPAAVTGSALRAAADRLTGSIAQVPPMYSAKRRQGRRLHELARAGERIELEPVPVVVHRIELEALTGDRLPLRVTCSAGTYVRVLAEELGRLVGCPAHLVALRRTAAGPLTLDRAVALDALDAPAARAALVPLDEMPLPLPTVRLRDEAAGRAFAHGQRLGADRWEPAGSAAPEVAVRDAGGALVGVARILADGVLAAMVVLSSP